MQFCINDVSTFTQTGSSVIGLKLDGRFGEPFFVNEYTKALFPGLWNDVIRPTIYNYTKKGRSQFRQTDRWIDRQMDIDRQIDRFKN